ncbi:hypothetical protein CW304_21690 [Bacillus sp. UFRGS-B20]|nr:hypothetical protein CW304_21690 [Bacillus sp. UFRGS-B20]
MLPDWIGSLKYLCLHCLLGSWNKYFALDPHLLILLVAEPVFGFPLYSPLKYSLSNHVKFTMSFLSCISRDSIPEIVVRCVQFSGIFLIQNIFFCYFCMLGIIHI